MTQIVKVHSAKSAKYLVSHFYCTGGVWTTKPFTNWEKARDRMRDHAKSDIHIQASEAALATQGRSVDIVQQLQKVGMQENEEQGCCQITDSLYSLSRLPTYCSYDQFQ